MFFNPLSLYTQKFQEQLEQYEKAIQENNHLTKEYIEQRKAKFKDVEQRIQDELKKVQYMNPADVYMSIINLNLPTMYWNIYMLWLEKVKEVYQLDQKYFANLIKITTPILNVNPFLSQYNIFDVYNHFNILKPQ